MRVRGNHQKIAAVDQVIALRIIQLRPTTLSIAMSLSGA